MKRIKYKLNLTNKDWLKIDFTKEKGDILKFIIQYYALVKNKIYSIRRYDTSHGVAHKHQYYLKGKPTKEILGHDYNKIFSEAYHETKNKFIKFKNYFLKK
ncbi:hypothetical protein CL633_02755 [bacterium]|nr:hypothetical protein [bacterium]|tara:strand:+ start:709 stop:1011 length:303 start_codon:yes stop_codon:yes gene_type:complete